MNYMLVSTLNQLKMLDDLHSSLLRRILQNRQSWMRSSMAMKIKLLLMSKPFLKGNLFLIIWGLRDLRGQQKSKGSPPRSQNLLRSLCHTQVSLNEKSRGSWTERNSGSLSESGTGERLLTVQPLVPPLVPHRSASGQASK